MSGFSPGTASPSPSTFWLPPPKKDKPSEATSVLRSRVRMLIEYFMVISCVLGGCWVWRDAVGTVKYVEVEVGGGSGDWRG